MSAEVSVPPARRSITASPIFGKIAASLVALFISFLLGALLVLALGESPLEVYGLLISGSLVGMPNFLVTLQMMSPLIFTGLAVAISFRAGLANIGAEGQMLVGALCAGYVGYAVELPALIHLPLCLLAAFVGGLVWALLPALLRVYLNVNEIVVCLMMNPIALLLTGYLSTRVLKAPGPTNKLPDIQPTAELSTFSLFSQANTGLIFALVLCLIFAVVNVRTMRGFEWQMIGKNAKFAYYGGVDVRRRALTVFLVSGGIAGLAGAEQVLGQYRAYYDDFSPGYGFDGIAVAMLAQFNPLAVPLAALLFGALNGGSAVLQMMTGLSKHLVQVLQFIVVLVLAAKLSWDWLKLGRSQTAAPGSDPPAEGPHVTAGDR
ncbi:sugar ABC transporter permease [Oceanicola granulosus HTCC2516]|uniref:Sugar ABC transporter permease n=1 Tax=Oceanicola granulosus (strain ATCC BAA-861 / DSM 15982 / KCTC 12143 / HTCC2516) TaxID=314256 RepID=Q2CH77_OCEGH|nr:ABC transporter permease [Oceanicola granulosus]EAR51934.1 sugar ABC transporter permease [Oceanicola granulosus HTCC2516]